MLVISSLPLYLLLQPFEDMRLGEFDVGIDCLEVLCVTDTLFLAFIFIFYIM